MSDVVDFSEGLVPETMSDACPLVLPSTASRHSCEGYITCGVSSSESKD